ncbi:mitochondrial 37S ribosomal protein uS17m [Lodderomyces beijingensis]|uniref:Uncharacterized protein n=1 Tax=Lodderomyces beijingensis TaxID=1775926 RepID=A0ABP0ZVQ7_9ASCO
MARQNFVGLVVSQGRANKTVKVRVQGKVYDRRVDKEIIRRKDFLVHDEGNICKEGDIVRIESIPKVSKRKAFAIAEIKVNRGQQFAQYEELARRRSKQEHEQEARKFLEDRQKFQSLITQLDDLKRLDELSHLITKNIETEQEAHAAGETAPSVDNSFLLNEVNAIKAKYQIQAWPSTEPILDIELNQPVYQTEIEKRVYHMKHILRELMENPSYAARKIEIIQDKLGKEKRIEDLKPAVQKNIMRSWLLKEKNECPVPFP